MLFRSPEIVYRFDPLNKDLRAHFKGIASDEKRMVRLDLRHYLTKTYGSEIAGSITDFFFRSYFDDDVGTHSITVDKYYAGVEKFVNSDIKEWQRLRFCLYDTQNKGRISERELFQLI